ncbi:MAG: right-handed parallel beta-helix repeat-containing protein [Akkermansiaceae bacterium]|nr:right-handed parallel beta-helix repeat-containing protein [Akkermansiaceae bacterium]
MRTSIVQILGVLWALSVGSGSAATLQVPAGYASIQSAINAAGKGDTILVAPGTYRERLLLKEGITLRSEGDDTVGTIGLKRAELTILDFAAGSGAGVAMAAGATLDGFTITGVGRFDEALWQHHFDTQGNEQSHEPIGEVGTPGIMVTGEATVRNNIVHHIGYTGIAITGGSPRIVNNVCHHTMGGGIGSMKGSTAQIEGNTCYGNFYAGIGCDASSPVIKNNRCHGNIRAGIGISEGSSPTVTGNQCYQNRRAGIGIRTGRETRPLVEGNDCTDNDMAGIGVEEGARPVLKKNRLAGNHLVAIGVIGGSDAVIEDNELSREGGLPPLIAVLEESRAVITGNTLRGGGVVGILVKGSAEVRNNRFLAPTAKNPILSFKGASLKESGNATLTDVVFKAAVDGSEQRYVELMPLGIDAKRPLDVVMAFHGHGSDRWQFINDPRGECRGVRDVAAKHGLLVVSPDYRAKTSWMGPDAEADVVQIIAELKERHRIGRVFLAGGSMGGTAVLTFAVLHPELIAGVCSLNGTANLVEYENFQDARTVSFGGSKAAVPEEYRKRSAEFFPEKLTMPLACTTGGKDASVPPDSVLRLVETLTRMKRRVLGIHREAGGHATSYEDTCSAMEFILREGGEASGLSEEVVGLEQRLAGIRTSASDLLADAKVFPKGAAWALRYESSLGPNELAIIRKALERGAERAEALAANTASWGAKKGKLVRGYVSAVDGSIQPYGVIIPEAYDGSKPVRLDVVLHGSSKPVGLSELKFMARFDEGDAAKPGPAADFIELHPLGRVENCYRWAGETDVFEAIEAVCRNYRIDRDRIVLRGMSMGASGTWHLGLKHPDRFVAIGPYCGYVDTHRFSETPIPGFIKVGPLPPHQELGLHMLDSVDYAANAGVVPAIGAIGDKDTFFQAHVIMGEAFAREGIPFVNLISPGTGHVIDPVTHAEQMRRIGEHAEKGLDHDPRALRFVTWTLKYNRCHWLELLALAAHYERAEFRARVADDGSLDIAEARNITRFAIHRPVTGIRINGVGIDVPSPSPGEALVFSQSGGGWHCDGPRSRVTLSGKRPGLQGPIDDAFATPFLCVRGTGQPWHAEVHDWAAAGLRRFEYEWHRFLRGDLPVKNDTEVTEADLRDKHLILFGDPGSNPWIAKALPHLPVTWTHDEVSVGGASASASNHSPVLIAPSPFAGDRYVVLNSGHTFHEKEFAAFNYLLFPRLGDWALMKVLPGGRTWQPAATDFPEETVRAGYFDEDWREASVPKP